MGLKEGIQKYSTLDKDAAGELADDVMEAIFNGDFEDAEELLLEMGCDLDAFDYL